MEGNVKWYGQVQANELPEMATQVQEKELSKMTTELMKKKFSYNYISLIEQLEFCILFIHSCI